MRRYCGWLLLGVGLLGLTWPALAVITADLPLKTILRNEFIFVAKVEKLDADPEKPRMVLKLEENLKGKAPFEKLPVNLIATSADGVKDKHTEVLLKRLAPDLPLVLFVFKKEDKYIAFVYTYGTWFQMHGAITDKNVVWSHFNCEPYLRKTFKGTTAELRQAIVDALANKKEPPPVDAKEKPGFGPEVKK